MMPMVDAECVAPMADGGTTRPLMFLQGGGFRWNVLLDSGASLCLVSKKMYKAGLFAAELQRAERSIVNASGVKMPPQGVVEATLRVSSSRCDVSLWVMDDLAVDMVLAGHRLVAPGW